MLWNKCHALMLVLATSTSVLAQDPPPCPEPNKCVTAAQKQKILGILARKQDEALEGASEEDLKKLLETL